MGIKCSLTRFKNLCWTYKESTISTHYSQSSMRNTYALLIILKCFYFLRSNQLFLASKSFTIKEQTFEMTCVWFPLSLCVVFLCVVLLSLDLLCDARNLFLHTPCICIVLRHWNQNKNFHDNWTINSESNPEASMLLLASYTEQIQNKSVELRRTMPFPN